MCIRDRDHTDSEQHRRGEAKFAAPNRGEPVQDFHAGRNGDEHRRDREGDDRDRTDAGHEHVVSPYAPTHEPDCDTGEHHCAVAEDRLATEGWDDLGDDAEARKDEDVHLGVTKDPEEVLPQQWVGAGFGVEEVGVEEAIDCLLYTSPSPRDATLSRMPSSA